MLEKRDASWEHNACIHFTQSLLSALIMLECLFLVGSLHALLCVRQGCQVFSKYNQNVVILSRGGNLYFNLYIIRVHENEEKVYFFGTRAKTRAKMRKKGLFLCLKSSKRVVKENDARNCMIPK